MATNPAVDSRDANFESTFQVPAQFCNANDGNVHVMRTKIRTVIVATQATMSATQDSAVLYAIYSVLSFCLSNRVRFTRPRLPTNQSRESKEDMRRQLERELRGLWVGPMPVQEFMDDFLPSSDINPMPEVPTDLIRSLPLTGDRTMPTKNGGDHPTRRTVPRSEGR